MFYAISCLSFQFLLHLVKVSNLFVLSPGLVLNHLGRVGEESMPFSQNNGRVSLHQMESSVMVGSNFLRKFVVG